LTNAGLVFFLFARYSDSAC